MFSNNRTTLNSWRRTGGICSALKSWCSGSLDTYARVYQQERRQLNQLVVGGMLTSEERTVRDTVAADPQRYTHSTISTLRSQRHMASSIRSLATLKHQQSDGVCKCVLQIYTNEVRNCKGCYAA